MRIFSIGVGIVIITGGITLCRIDVRAAWHVVIDDARRAVAAPLALAACSPSVAGSAPPVTC